MIVPGSHARTSRVVTTLLFGVIALALSLFARDAKPSPSETPYSHGETSCLQGNDGPGLRLRLRQQKRCEGRVSYPFLEIDIRELPVPARNRVIIATDNWAQRCPDPNEACEQSLSGTIVFDHFDKPAREEGIQTDGHYELRFRNSKVTGHFQVDCLAPCG